MRAQPRPRRPISDAKLRLLTPVLRYSPSRDAYVLRGFGRHIGPVYRRDTTSDLATSAGEQPTNASTGGDLSRR